MQYVLKWRGKEIGVQDEWERAERIRKALGKGCTIHVQYRGAKIIPLRAPTKGKVHSDSLVPTAG